MTSDLAVDTALIRHAAQLLDGATDSFDGDAGAIYLECPLTDSSLGSTAVAREVAGAARRRVTQAIESVAILTQTTSQTATRLRDVAGRFEIVESATANGPR